MLVSERKCCLMAEVKSSLSFTFVPLTENDIVPSIKTIIFMPLSGAERHSRQGNSREKIALNSSRVDVTDYMVRF